MYATHICCKIKQILVGVDRTVLLRFPRRKRDQSRESLCVVMKSRVSSSSNKPIPSSSSSSSSSSSDIFVVESLDLCVGVGENMTVKPSWNRRYEGLMIMMRESGCLDMMIASGRELCSSLLAARFQERRERETKKDTIN